MNSKSPLDVRRYWESWILLGEEFDKLHHDPKTATWVEEGNQDPRFTREYQKWMDARKSEDEQFAFKYYKWNLSSEDKVLFAGCGPGHNVRKYEQQQTTLIGVDVAFETIRLAKLFKAEQAKAKQYFVCADLENLPFKTDSFTKVMSNGVIHHTSNPDKCLHEINRCAIKNAEVKISVYIKNFLLTPLIFPLTKATLKFLKYNMPGRSFDQVKTPDEFIRIYDGDDNPVGFAHTRRQWKNILSEYYQVKHIERHNFTFRIFKNWQTIPKVFLKLMDRYAAYMDYFWCINKK